MIESTPQDLRALADEREREAIVAQLSKSPRPTDSAIARALEIPRHRVRDLRLELGIRDVATGGRPKTPPRVSAAKAAAELVRASQPEDREEAIALLLGLVDKL